MNIKPHPLSDIVSAIKAHATVLGMARNAFLAKKAEKDHFESTMVITAPGESNAEKTNRAKAQFEWLEFHKSLNRLESEYEFYKLQFKVLELEYQAQYLALKLDAGLIKKEQ